MPYLIPRDFFTHQQMFCISENGNETESFRGVGESNVYYKKSFEYSVYRGLQKHLFIDFYIEINKDK